MSKKNKNLKFKLKTMCFSQLLFLNLSMLPPISIANCQVQFKNQTESTPIISWCGSGLPVGCNGIGREELGQIVPLLSPQTLSTVKGVRCGTPVFCNYNGSIQRLEIQSKPRSKWMVIVNDSGCHIQEVSEFL